MTVNLVFLFIGAWSWYVKKFAVHSYRQPRSSAGWWREHLDAVGLLMLWCRPPAHPEYEDFTPMDDEPTQDERNAGPMVWNPAPPKEITHEEARRAYRDWNVSACASRRAPDLVAAGWVAAH